MQVTTTTHATLQAIVALSRRCHSCCGARAKWVIGGIGIDVWQISCDSTIRTVKKRLHADVSWLVSIPRACDHALTIVAPVADATSRHGQPNSDALIIAAAESLMRGW